MFVKITNGQVNQYPYTIGDLRKDNPNVSFPKNISEETLNRFGVFSVKTSAPPTVNNLVETHTDSVQLVNGVWTQVWTVVRFDEDRAAKNVRSQRDSELMRSDWTQIADAPVNKAAWATYRQSLRDVTLQAGFPWNVSWPNKPNV